MEIQKITEQELIEQGIPPEIAKITSQAVQERIEGTKRTSKRHLYLIRLTQDQITMINSRFPKIQIVKDSPAIRGRGKIKNYVSKLSASELERFTAEYPEIQIKRKWKK